MRIELDEGEPNLCAVTSLSIRRAAGAGPAVFAVVAGFVFAALDFFFAAMVFATFFPASLRSLDKTMRRRDAKSDPRRASSSAQGARALGMEGARSGGQARGGFASLVAAPQRVVANRSVMTRSSESHAWFKHGSMNADSSDLRSAKCV